MMVSKYSIESHGVRRHKAESQPSRKGDLNKQGAGWRKDETSAICRVLLWNVIYPKGMAHNVVSEMLRGDSANGIAALFVEP